jgi:hypothetical protein
MPYQTVDTRMGDFTTQVHRRFFKGEEELWLDSLAWCCRPYRHRPSAVTAADLESGLSVKGDADA